MAYERYTLSYRAVEAQQLMDWVRAGQSGCLIGLRGAGKSNFLRFLLRKDVQLHYLGQDQVNFAFILINLLSLTERTEWEVYDLVLERLLGQLCPAGVDKDAADEMSSLHRRVRRSRDPFTAQRALEQCVDILCQRSAQRIVLLFDEFDAVFGTLAPSLFRCLRAIRDAHKEQVCYIVVVAHDLACLRRDLAQVEHFYRLVSRNICGLGPYNETDARQMMRHLASQRSVVLNKENETRLIELCGGHAGLLKATLSLLWDVHHETNLAELAPALNDEPVVRAECQKVWDSLSEGEQAALCALASGEQVDPQALHRLKRRGLVREERSGTCLFCQLFADFVHQQSPPWKERVSIDRSLGTVMIDGRRVELTELEFEMLCYLYEHRGRVCTKDELIENVYRQQYDRTTGGIDDARLQTLVSRLRAKVEPPRYIATVRGEGYKFVEKDEREPQERHSQVLPEIFSNSQKVPRTIQANSGTIKL